MNAAADTLDFAMFDLPAMTAEEAARAKALRERKAAAARLAYRTAEREGAEDPSLAARTAAELTC